MTTPAFATPSADTSGAVTDRDETELATPIPTRPTCTPMLWT